MSWESTAGNDGHNELGAEPHREATPRWRPAQYSVLGTQYSVLGTQKFLAVLLAVLTLALPTWAVSPSGEVLRLVPDEVGFCFVVQDLRSHTAALLRSPFVEHFRSSPLGLKLLSAPEVQKLAEVQDYFQKQFQLDWARLRDDVFGDAVVLAYRPSPPGEPGKDQGLLLIRAREAKLLEAFVQRLNDLQKQSGDLQKLEVREHHGVAYYRRVERTGENYYYLRGPVLAFTGQEAMLLQAIDRDRSAAADVEAPVARQLRLLGVDQRLAVLWINPRAFEPELRQKAATATGAEAAALRTLLIYWKALEGVALSATLHKDLELALAIRARVPELPSSAQRFLTTAARPSELWSRFPDQALLVLAGRLDVAALVELLSEFMTEDARKVFCAAFDRHVEAVLGKDVVQRLVTALGPDWGFCITAPPAADKAWFPHLVAALRVRRGDAAASAPLTILGALNAFAMLAVLSHNREHPDPASLQTIRQDRVEVKYLVNDSLFPPGFQPAFAFKDGFVLLASAPEAIRRFNTVTSPLASAPSPEEVPLLRLSLRALYTFLKDRREPLLLYSAKSHGISAEEAGLRLDNLLGILQLFDQLEVTQRAASGQATLTLRVQTARPLK